MVTVGSFNPVAFISDLLPEFPDMPSWAFPRELKAGLAGVLEYLHEDDHLFSPSPPPPPVPPHRPLPKKDDTEVKEEDAKIFTEFFPEISCGYQYSSDYSSSVYSSPVSYNQENVFPGEAKSFYSGQQEPLYQGGSVQLQSYCISPPSTYIYAPTFYPTFPHESPLSAALKTENSPHTPPYTPRNYESGKKSPPAEPVLQKGKLRKSEEVCSNCETTESPMWRWNPNGQRECNACNLYEAGKGVKRPPTLWKQKILRRRKRNPKVLEEQNRRSAPY